MHIALLLSKMVSLIKISKSCSKVIKRTLRSGKNWLRYASFSVISQVKWPNLRAWPNFSALQDSSTHTGKTRQCVKKKTSKSDTAWLLEDAPRKSVLITSIHKVSIFLQNMLGKSLQYRHFTSKIAFFRNQVLLFWSNFGRPHGRPPSDARISI